MNSGDGVQWRSLCAASMCGCISPTKPMVHKDLTSEGAASWWLMSWGMAQAGDRASQTGLYGQWWDRDAEHLADTSDRHNLHHSSNFVFSFCLLQIVCTSGPSTWYGHLWKFSSQKVPQVFPCPSWSIFLSLANVARL